MGNYFIKVEDGPDVRRKLLEASKAGLHVLHGYQELKILRSQKLSEMNTLRTEMKELNLLLNRLDSLLPELAESELREFSTQPLPNLPDINAPKKNLKAVKNSSKTVFIKPPKHEVVTQVPVTIPKLEPVVREVTKARPLSELEKLQKALEDVEGKLDKL